VSRRSVPTFTILDALEDGALFGALPAFRDLSSWRTWLTFLRATCGLPRATTSPRFGCLLFATALSHFRSRYQRNCSDPAGVATMPR